MRKTTDYSFDLEVLSQRSHNGKIKVFLSIDKIHALQQGSDASAFETDIVNCRGPKIIAMRRLDSGQTFQERVREASREIEKAREE